MPENENQAPRVEPVDLALAKLEQLIREMEEAHQTAEELAQLPDDIPRFSTRYTP